MNKEMNKDEVMGRKELDMFLLDPSNSRAEKLIMFKRFCDENGIDIPKGTCVCVSPENNGVTLLQTSGLDGAVFNEFADKFNPGTTRLEIKDLCSGTYFKQD